MAKSSSPLLLIVDGNAILHRAYHALPPMTVPDGRVVHAAYGFLTVFFKALADLQPSHVAVTFDLPGGTFRNELFPEYQAQREEQPDELYAQIPMVKDVLVAMGMPVYEAAGFEADDVIGTIVERVKSEEGRVKRGMGVGSSSTAKVIVLTGDKDLLQLVGDGVEVVLLRRGMTDTGRYDRDAVIERFGFPPEHIPDFKALAGDPSDNYSGIPGIGEKTAAALVQEFGGVEEILEDAKTHTLKPPLPRGGGETKKVFSPTRVEGEQEGMRKRTLTDKLAAKLRDHAETARLGLRLATIVRTVPVEFRLSDCARRGYDRAAVVATLRGLGFTSLLNRLPTPFHSPSPDATVGAGQREGEKQENDSPPSCLEWGGAQDNPALA